MASAGFTDCGALTNLNERRLDALRTKLTRRRRTRRPPGDHATLRNSTVGPSHRDDQTSAHFEAQRGDTEEEVLRSIVVRNGDLGNEGLQAAMPEREGAGPVNGFSLINQALCCHLTSANADPARRAFREIGAFSFLGQLAHPSHTPTPDLRARKRLPWPLLDGNPDLFLQGG